MCSGAGVEVNYIDGASVGGGPGGDRSVRVVGGYRTHAEGGLSAENYIRITGTSRAPATRGLGSIRYREVNPYQGRTSY